MPKIVAIAVETPLQDEVRELVAELDATLLALTPPEHCHHLTVEQMADCGTTVFVAREGDRHHAAWTVYERAGFSRCGPVLDYPDVNWSVFYEKTL